MKNLNMERITPVVKAITRHRIGDKPAWVEEVEQEAWLGIVKMARKRRVTTYLAARVTVNAVNDLFRERGRREYLHAGEINLPMGNPFPMDPVLRLDLEEWISNCPFDAPVIRLVMEGGYRDYKNLAKKTHLKEYKVKRIMVDFRHWLEERLDDAC